MTEKDKFIAEILALVKQPLLPGQNPINVTEENVAELNGAPDLTTAMAIATNLFGAEYVDQYALSKGIQTQDYQSVVNQNILGISPYNFIGVTADQTIVYGGEATTIGAQPGNFYQEGDQNVFANLLPEEVRELQADMVNAGLLGDKVGKPFRPGFFDIRVEGRVMEQLMAQANASGLGKAEKGYQNVLQLYLDNPVSSPVEYKPYLPPDYSAVSNSVNGLFERELGREPLPYEKKLLADQFLEDSQLAYEQAIPDPLPDVTPDTLDDYGNHTTSDVPKEQIDPGANLVETFNNITAKEQERLGTNRDIQATNRIILNSITGAPR
jgi:hypothetical protein